MAKLVTLFVLTLLLVSTLSFAARSGPPFPAKNEAQGTVETEQSTEVVEVEDSSCEGVGEDECLMRRTLAAHVDYIYTQNQKP